nr:unnamed protein product [Digitaria exilis]
MASFYRGSAISLLQHRVLRPSALQSRAFCGSTRDFSKVYRAPAARRTPSIHGRVSASSPERVQESSPPMTPWVERWLPAAARPSIAMAAEKAELPDMKMPALFGFGSVILRGVACTVNDLLDRDIDKKVERTKSRPLASGALTPAHGFYFLVFEVLLWLGFLLQLNNHSLALTGYNAHLAWQYYPFLAAAAGHLTWQGSAVDLSNKSDCNSKFVSNKWFGAFIFGGILCGVLAS